MHEGVYVVLEDGSRIRGIQEITLKAGVDQQLWSLDLKVTPIQTRFHCMLNYALLISATSMT